MGFHNIEKKSFLYNTLFYYVRFWHNTIFYRKVLILNYNKVPEDTPAMFTPNHQNALMDALALLFSINRQLVFMARSDIFKKFAPILYFLKILPIYRIRDGIDSLKKNKVVFDKTVDVLNANNGLVILPEGNHKGTRQLRQLKKGFARIAFQTQMEGNLKSSLKIVPVGIDYDNYINCRSRLIVNFGSPIEVPDFIDDYKKKPPIGLNNIKEELSKRIKELIIHIESDKYYDFINEWRVIFRKEMCNITNRNYKSEEEGFYADKQLVEILNSVTKSNPETIEILNNNYQNLKKNLKGKKITVTQLTNTFGILKTTLKTLVLTTTFPLFIYGAINHLFPFFLPYYLSRKVKDKMFHSSFMYVLTMLFFPIYYTLQTVAIWIFTDFITALIYLLSLPISAIISWKWNKLFNSAKNDIRLHKLKNSGQLKSLLQELEKIKKETIDLVLINQELHS